MKKLCSRLFGVGALGALVVAGSASARAQVAPTYVAPTYYYAPSGELGFHLGGDLGASIMQDFNSSRFGFPGHFSTQPGVRLSVAPGYDFLTTDKLTLGAGFETGMIYNYIHRVQDAGAWTPYRGDYYQVPLLGELVLKFHANGFVVPYIGAGGGGDCSFARLHPRGYYFDGDRDSDKVDPAVQGMAGVSFRVNPMTEVGLGYKYLAAFEGSGNSTTQTHAVLATFNLKF